MPGRLRIYGTDRNFLRRKDNIYWPSATIWDQYIFWVLYCHYCIGSWCSPMYLVCMAFHCYMVFPCVIAYTEIGFQRKQTKLSEETTQRSFLEQTDPACLPAMSLPDALDDAITAAGRSILQLGGYMIFFNLLNLLPRLLLPDSFRYAPLLEISGGLKLLGDRFPLYTLLLLPFGGLSCIAQTGSCIRNTGLSSSPTSFIKWY